MPETGEGVVRIRRMALEVTFVSPPASPENAPEIRLAALVRVAAPEKISQRSFGAFRRINIASSHAGLQRFGRQIRHDNLAGTLDYPIRYGFSHLDSGNALH